MNPKCAKLNTQTPTEANSAGQISKQNYTSLLIPFTLEQIVIKIGLQAGPM